MEIKKSFIADLPDVESAQRFFQQFNEKYPSQAKKLQKNEGLLSDILALASFSPLLATTLLQNPNYVWWLSRHRAESKVRDKEELLESLARFSLTSFEVEPNILLARFRRRELLRIFLHDIRRLSTVAEITEELSNLADSILEYALRLARQEIDNRFGIALEKDEKGRDKPSSFCIVSLGKLGSKELNYSSDIDLLFLYSDEGATSGQGTRGAVTNREYFVKLAEFVSKIVGGQSGEGAAYRVDLRLRPHGRVGALALSVKDTIRYFQNEAQAWERQVLIRSRSSAGDAELYKKFFRETESYVFSVNETVENALRNVRLSKEKINLEHAGNKGFNLKLGEGGIREIEFIAQALQLAYGGKDSWLRSQHTLKSLSNLADRNLITENETSELFDAYDFLRRAEHLLQMKNGVQTHTVPDDSSKRNLLAKKMSFQNAEEFAGKLFFHTANVNRIFKRIFGNSAAANINFEADPETEKIDVGNIDVGNPEIKPPEDNAPKSLPPQLVSSIEKSTIKISREKSKTLKTLIGISPHYAEMLTANPRLINHLPSPKADFAKRDYRRKLVSAVGKATNYAGQLEVLRKNWSRYLLEIIVFDVYERHSIRETKRLQTELAEASIEAALSITKSEMSRRMSAEIKEFPFAVLGLGKLGGKGIDYGSDLDLLLVYDDEKPLQFEGATRAEFYSRAVEIFVTALSSLTREGHLYRVDLRLRPDGKNGATSIGVHAFTNYLQKRAAIWEWLAYVKVRGVAGDYELAINTERQAREIIHANACKTKTSDADCKELRDETLRIRQRLEEQKTPSLKNKEIDIKFGAGGMLDVYFAVRFLQLKDNVPDEDQDRSTVFMIKKLFENGSLNKRDYENFLHGYEFLSVLDHNLRLTIGRSTLLPLAYHTALNTISTRMNLSSISDLLEKLTMHRLNIRQTYENILS
jgi:glutamate-ammonia-ligase adenylyltransferase